MAYENLPLNGNPTGNYLYITIPIRGTDNWDEKLKEGFFNRVVDHDHTPGKGAAIQEAALDNALQTKVAAIAVNTSEIAQNALDISQNAAAILANATNINSNDTDIANLDIRLTTAESDKITATDAQNLIDNNLSNYSDTAGVQALISSSNIETLSNVDNLTPSDGNVLVYNTNFSRWIPAAPSTGGTVIELNNSTDVANIANTTVKNAIVRINTNGGISNVVFENCTIGIDTPNNGPSFNTCTLKGCSVRDSSGSNSGTVSFRSSSALYEVDVHGFGSCSLESSTVEGITINSCENLIINSCTGMERMNIQARYLFIYNQCTVYHSTLNIAEMVQIVTGTADSQVFFYNTVLNTSTIYSQVSYSITIHETSKIDVHYSYTTVSGTGGTFYLKIANNSGTTLVDTNVGNSSLLHSPFTIQDGQLVVSNPSNVEVLTAGRGSTTTVDGYTFFDVLSTVNEASYDPNSIISSGQITLAQGNYLITASCELSTAVHIQLKMSITPSGGSKAIVRQHFSPSVATLNEILLVASDGDVLEIECGSQYAATAETNFIIKKIS